MYICSSGRWCDGSNEMTASSQTIPQNAPLANKNDVPAAGKISRTFGVKYKVNLSKLYLNDPLY